MEKLDVYDNEGNRTGRVVVRGDKSTILSEDEHIAVGVIFIENSKGEFLIQKTSIKKGGKYSSTGGHVDSGETPIESIIREVKEELGIDISNDDVNELGFLLYDKPLRYMFYLRKDICIDDIVVDNNEVESVSYMSLEEIRALMDDGLFTSSHGIILDKVLEHKKNIITL